MNGKLIVIDGTDGSGKTNQTEMLISKLKEKKFDVATTDFPQYGKKSAGPIEEYLNGAYGKTADEVNPYKASILYAVDRFDASFKMKEWLNAGKIIVSNRYVSANMGHQGAKINTQIELKKYLDWLYNLEYEIFEIPKPNLNIILHVPSEISFELIAKKNERQYLNGKKRDIHECDINHLKKAEKVYLQMVNNFSNFIKIECAENNQIMSKEKISNLIWNEVIKIL